ncbi:hypothetical protein [Streptomyces beihaiensis]|uniref:Uncharacterized protein n=1 Tax=Streptomyces beihaiensis TaxID=2984495 RepID=A0ABT3U681_9ACTN|nr:hypothetical protein [Streptomyces beihaiensis]MCX3063715.1 hypothetical protein [Streptomyces beihaiensis]
MSFDNSRTGERPQRPLAPSTGSEGWEDEQRKAWVQPTPAPQNPGPGPNSLPELPPPPPLPPSIAALAASPAPGTSAEAAAAENASDDRFPRRPPAGVPTRDTVEAVGQAAVLQRAFNNYGEQIGTKYVYEQTLDSHAPISREYLAVVREVYAEPHREDRLAPSSPFQQALETLRAAGSVMVINRPPNSSRTFTAYALFAHLLDDGAINEVRPLSFGGSKHFPTRRLPHDRHCGYLLELPPDEGDFVVDESFGGNLTKLVERLLRRDCRLIVLTRPEQWRRISHGAPDGVAPELGAVSPRDIAERWLLAQEADFPADLWLDHKDIRPLLAGQAPTDVLNLVYLMLEQHRAAQSATPVTADLEQALRQKQSGSSRLTFDKQVANVVAAHSNWEDALYRWHEPKGRTRTSFERNFLLAAAVLRGDPVGHVYAKAAELTEKLDDVPVEVDGQREPGVIAMTRAVGARREDDGTLTFTRPHWDDAVIEYFWNDRPLARTTFLEWLAHAPVVDTDVSKEALEIISKDGRLALAQRVGQFALRWAVRHRRQTPLERIVEEWYKQGTTKELWPLAVELLDSAAIHAASAPYIHSMLLAWSSRNQPHLQRVVVEVCTGAFGRRHTAKALRRLRNVAAQGRPDVIDALREAVRVLWEDATVRQMLFGYVVDWCKSEKTSQTVGHRTFSALALNSPPEASGLPPLLQAMAEENSDEEDAFHPTVQGLVTGWRTLLRQAAGPTGERDLDKAVFTWLDAARERHELKSVVFDTLRQAVNVPGAEGPILRETLRTSAQWWVQGQDRPYSKEKDDLKRELSALLDQDLIARRNQPIGGQPLSPGASCDEPQADAKGDAE